ncbi:L,D-transpeptidase [Bdellovibrio svalbardensis]|uniref:L,D-transpeptidase n=1 Tax=Bdellovibrio svalbardensis TaxID=2972972 RepID=A0ABT6DE51_9BACT|nr:L,D-transpeptidase [Bdellovibrio svalbardensis]MDG0815107.1 L,D-transpeptidase [Bdellovibrio svalbardensis]
MKLLAAAMLVLATTISVAPSAHAETVQELEAKLMVEKPYEAPRGRLFDEEAYFRGELAINQFTNVVVVNKAAYGSEAQTARLYINRQLVLKTKVSTGREDVEYIAPLKGLFRKIFQTKGTSESHWRHTLRGFYGVTRVMDENYKSGESKVQMPYAMFFNDTHGLALHQVPPDLIGGEANGIAALGTRASSGCVRVNKDQVIQIHDAVVAADQGQVPVIDSRTGQQVVDQYGRPQTKIGWKTIVIVEEF